MCKCSIFVHIYTLLYAHTHTHTHTHTQGPLPSEQQPGLEFPYPSDPVKNVHSEKKAKVKKSKPKNEPTYTVTHRGEVDMGDFTNSRFVNVYVDMFTYINVRMCIHVMQYNL